MPPEYDARQDKQARAAQAKQVVDIFLEISTLLNSELDRETLSVCISLIENGINPEALAGVVRELRKEGEEIKKEIRGGQE
ncbi:mitotic-spindle organizing gamma-tubulin ring associated-domain-containing protein [Calycina marina]|uniref:Mitotic-spindle organizing protein 1 n=1 Tax=Calycina marina TaxID=1763456 RepID=A0A9P7ZB28_9HELO|nr:mitotic-spindle organizing gamma-tubulin ring associated-domain-containing protein [Calycina marina]